MLFYMEYLGKKASLRMSEVREDGAQPYKDQGKITPGRGNNF